VSNQTRLQKFADLVGQVAIGAVVVASVTAIVWVFSSRTLDQIQNYTLRIAFWVGALFLVLGIIVASVKNEEVDDGWWRKGANWLYIVLFAAIFSVVVGLTYYSIAVGIKDAYLWFSSLPFTRDAAIGVLTGSTVAAGLVLFVFRLYLRSLYGLSEVVAGVFISTLKISEKTPAAIDTADPALLRILVADDLYVVVLTAGVYLVVRGLDNVHQGVVKDPRDPLATKIVNWLTSPNEAKPSAGTPEIRS
jgi:hypothetical protein